ncbi:MAG: TrbG/VirB9 family P-type conjugative transfer protein [Cypionkella sp.]
MTRSFSSLPGLFLGLSLCATASAIAEVAPASMGADARVRAVLYNPVDVVRLDTHLRVNTAIELGAGERIDSVLLGDSEAFEVEVLSNRTTVSIKPVIAGAETNMTIYTGRRTISLAISEGRSLNPTYRLVLRYPEASKARASKPATGSSRDIGYAWSGDTSLKPIHIWNDGQATYFAFAPGLRPSIFGVDSTGREVTLNSGTRGSIVRVPGLRSAYSIRIGTQVLCIERVEGGVTINPTLIAKLQGWEF